ncbi:unnamed protein product [Prorocentrum cordatum]|uniref:FACT complex subunit n=1 Tax=Prorocentrum cordatum TaxID=2364126 RepID=A0ABN9VMZ5_9DINO|nr:unnamed protein product [Polarella glacialis]
MDSDEELNNGMGGPSQGDCEQREQSPGAEDDDEAGSGAAQPAGRKDKAKGRAKGGAKKKRSKGSPKKSANGRPTTVKAGRRQCTDCGLTKLLSEFKPGSTVCLKPCLRTRDNIYRACKAENEIEWYEAQRSCPKKWAKLKRWYRLNCQDFAKEHSKPKAFAPMQYKQSVRVEQQQLRDGVKEMMHEVAFVHWASKPKNWPPRGLSSSEASAEFKRRIDDPEEIVDYMGEHKGYETRLGVAVRTVLVDRDAYIRGQGYDLLDKATKKTTQEDIDRACNKLHTNLQDVTGASAQLDSKGVFQLLSKGAKAADRASLSSAFDGQLVNLGGIKGLAGAMKAAADDGEEVDDEDVGSDGHEEEATDPKSKKKRKVGQDGGDQPPAEKKRKIWVEKDLKIAAAVRTQETWATDISKVLRDLHSQSLDLVNQVNEHSFGEKFKTEVNVINMRARACSLVLGLADHSKAWDDQPEELVGPMLTEEALAEASVASLRSMESPMSKASPACSPPSSKSCLQLTASPAGPPEAAAEQQKLEQKPDQGKAEGGETGETKGKQTEGDKQKDEQRTEGDDQKDEGGEHGEKKDEQTEGDKQKDEQQKDIIDKKGNNDAEAAGEVFGEKKEACDGAGAETSTLAKAPDVVDSAEKVDKVAVALASGVGGPPRRMFSSSFEDTGGVNVDRFSATTSTEGLSIAERREKRAARNLKVFIAGFRSSQLTPPCRSYRSLIVLHEYQPYWEKLKLAESEADLKQVAEEVKPFKIALNDLISMTRNATNTLKNALKQACEKNKDGGKARKVAKGDKAGIALQGSGSRLQLFDRGVEKGTAMPTFEIAQDIPVNALATPTRVKNVSQEDLDALTEMANAFAPKFQSSRLRTTDGRAEKPIKGDAVKNAMSVLHAVVLDSPHLPFEKMHAELQPAVFGICKAMETVSIERGRCPSLRVHTQGCRQVVAASCASLRSFMERNGMSQVGPDHLLSFFKGMAKESIDAFLSSGGRLCHTMVSSGEGVVIPFNFVFAEKVISTSDALGVRLSFWMKSDEAAMEACSRWLITAKKPNSWLQSAVECVVEEGCD